MHVIGEGMIRTTGAVDVEGLVTTAGAVQHQVDDRSLADIAQVDGELVRGAAKCRTDVVDGVSHAALVGEVDRGQGRLQVGDGDVVGRGADTDRVDLISVD